MIFLHPQHTAGKHHGDHHGKSLRHGNDEDADGLNYLQQRTITEINHAAVEGTTLAHVSGGVPVMKIEMPKIDETILGELIYMMEYACGVSGYMLDVNPFDQPGVEAYKRNMFHILGKKGY
jgi:glucose-6-phosphate isomerase